MCVLSLQLPLSLSGDVQEDTALLACKFWPVQFENGLDQRIIEHILVAPIMDLLDEDMKLQVHCMYMYMYMWIAMYMHVHVYTCMCIVLYDCTVYVTCIISLLSLPPSLSPSLSLSLPLSLSLYLRIYVCTL